MVETMQSADQGVAEETSTRPEQARVAMATQKERAAGRLTTTKRQEGVWGSNVEGAETRTPGEELRDLQRVIAEESEDAVAPDPRKSHVNEVSGVEDVKLKPDFRASPGQQQTKTSAGNNGVTLSKKASSAGKVARKKEASGPSKDAQGGEQPICTLGSVGAYIHSSLKRAVCIAETTTDTVLLLETLTAASSVAAKHLPPESHLKVANVCSQVLLKYADETAALKDARCGDILPRIEKLRRLVQPNRDLDLIGVVVLVSIRYYLCSYAFLCALKKHTVFMYGIEETLKVLFRKQLPEYTQHANMELFGKTCFYSGLVYYNSARYEESSVRLKFAFDSFYDLRNLKADDWIIRELYSLVFNAGSLDNLEVVKSVTKHAFVKLTSISNCSWSERILKILTVIWMSKLLGDRKVVIEKYLKLLFHSSVGTLERELMKPAASFIVDIVAWKVTPRDPTLKRKLIKYALTLCLQTRKLYRKFQQLDRLSLAVVKLAEDERTKDDKPDESSRFYFLILKMFLSEIDKESKRADCAWMLLRLCNANLYLGKFSTLDSDYDESLTRAKEVFRIMSSHKGEKEEDLQFAKVEAHNLACISYCQVGQHHRGFFHLEEKILLLEKQPKGTAQVLLLKEAKIEKEMMEKVLEMDRVPAIFVPRGLFQLCPLHRMHWATLRKGKLYWSWRCYSH